MPQSPITDRVSLSEVLSALSYALDLTEGATPGHTLRTCLIGMRIAEEAGVSAAQRSALYYAILLKDAGCSSNAGRMAAMFGSDEQYVKPRMKLVNWHQRAIARSGDMTKDLIQIRCDRGASIALQLGFPAETADAIRSLDEHWCGLGYARGLAGADIPLLARIANLAQTVEAFHHKSGARAALRVARQRSGSWFDPMLVRLVQRWKSDDAWWALLRGDVSAAVVAAEPTDQHMQVDADGLDTCVVRSPTSSMRRVRSRTTTPLAWPTSPASSRPSAGWMRRSSGASIAPGCCTTSASSVCRTRFSTRTDQ